MESDEEHESPSEDAWARSGLERRLLLWFVVLLGINILSVLGLATRAESPSYVRIAIDFFLRIASGGVIALIAFRAMFFYPFRFPELLAIVFVLSLGVKAALRFVQDINALGIIPQDPDSFENIAAIVQWCLLVLSVLAAGAALGLRNCQVLMLDKLATRLNCILSATLALPAAAGCVVFGVLLLIDTLTVGSSPRDFWLAPAWIASIYATGVNCVYFFRSLVLNASIDAREKLP